jgi:hypothetical protein
MIMSATSNSSKENNNSRFGAMPIISRLAFGSNVATRSSAASPASPYTLRHRITPCGLVLAVSIATTLLLKSGASHDQCVLFFTNVSGPAWVSKLGIR